MRHSLALCLLFLAVTAASADSFALKIGTDIDIGKIKQTADSGYVVCGVLGNSRNGDALILKFDSSGNIEWSKSLGGTDFDYAVDCFPTADGHFMVGGNTLSLTFPAEGVHYDAFLAKLDRKGKLLWTKSFFGIGDDLVTGITPTVDGGTAVVGETYTFEASEPENHTNLDLYLAKFDQNGNLIWTRHFGTRGDDHSSAVITTSDNGLLFGGWLLTGDGGFIAKANGKGKIQWIRSFPDLSGIQDVAESSQGNYVFTATFYIGFNPVLHSDVAVLAMNSKGKVLWRNVYGFGTVSELPSTIVSTSDGGSLVSTYRYSQTKDAVLLFKLDAKGAIDWTRTISVPESHRSSAIQTSDGANAFISSTSYSPLRFFKFNPPARLSGCDNIRPTKLYRKKLNIPARTPTIHFKSIPAAHVANRSLTTRTIQLSQQSDCGAAQ